LAVQRDGLRAVPSGDPKAQPLEPGAQRLARGLVDRELDEREAVQAGRVGRLEQLDARRRLRVGGHAGGPFQALA
jgi:hypothetical protein